MSIEDEHERSMCKTVVSNCINMSIEHEHERSMSIPTMEKKHEKDVDHLLPSRLKAPALLAPPKV